MRAGAIIAAALLLVLALRHAGSWLVVADAQPADAIVVLNGEWAARPDEGEELLQAGLAPRLYLSVNDEDIYGQPLAELARRWAGQQRHPERIAICDFDVDSTRDEALAMRHCLPPAARRVIVVSSAFHTRRARLILERALPGRTIFAAPATDPEPLRHWWQDRKAAKDVASEWAKLAWWFAVDRWRT